MTKFWFKHFASLSDKMVSTSSIKNFQETKKCYFQTPVILVIELKESSNPFSKKLPMTIFWFKQFLMFCLTFPQNDFNFVDQKFQKLKISLSKWKEHSHLISRSLQNHFLKSFLWPTLNLHCLEGSVSFSQKTVSTSSLKTVQKTENALFKHSEYLFLSSS